jgi:hypothetical protein
MFNEPQADHDPSRAEVVLPVGPSYPSWEATEEQKEQLLQRDLELWNEQVRI